MSKNKEIERVGSHLGAFRDDEDWERRMVYEREREAACERKKEIAYEREREEGEER